MELLRTVTERSGVHRVFILDACRSNVGRMRYDVVDNYTKLMELVK